MATMHEVDYKIFGDDMQFVEVELDPMEAVVAEAGGMMYMDDGIEMETVFGDGSQLNSGFLSALMGAGKRLLIGESLFMTVFQNRGSGKRRVAFGAPYPGKIIPVHLAEIGRELIAQKDSFLCAAKGVSVGIAFNKRIGAGLFGGEGFIMERLEGTAGHSSTQAAHSISAISVWARSCESIPAALWDFSRRWISIFSSSARSSPPCSAAKDCSSPPCAGRDGSGSNRCRSAAWPNASSLPHRKPVVGDVRKARSWADWAGSSMGITPDNHLLRVMAELLAGVAGPLPNQTALQPGPSPARADIDRNSPSPFPSSRDRLVSDWATSLMTASGVEVPAVSPTVSAPANHSGFRSPADWTWSTR